MISFKANYVSNAYINRLGIDKKWHEKSVSFVKIDPLLANDREALNTLNCEWDNCETYANDICARMNTIALAQDPEPAEEIYALTLQKDNFSKLQPEGILGLIQTTCVGVNQCIVDYLQADPSNKFGAEYRNYSKIGSAIIESLKKVFNKHDLILNADENAIPFYIKKGFSELGGGGMIFRR